MSKAILSSIYQPTRSLNFLHSFTKNSSLLTSTTKPSILPIFSLNSSSYSFSSYKTYYKDKRFHKPYDNIGKGNPAIRPKQPLGPDGKDADIRYKEGNNKRNQKFYVENYVNVNK